MKVLVASHLALPHVGGVENLVDLEVRALAAAGHAVALVTSDGSGAGRTPTYPDSVRVIRVPARHILERQFGIPFPLFGPRILAVLWNEIRAADVVHAHGFLFQNTALAVLLAKMQGKPCVLTDHGGIQKFGSVPATLAARLGAETVGRLSATLASRVVTYNARIQGTLNRLGRRKDAEFIPNPVDGSLFFPPTASERAAARAALGWTGERKKVFFVGRLIATKGVPLLLEAQRNPVSALETGFLSTQEETRFPKQKPGFDSFDIVFCGPGDASILGPLPRPGVEYLPPRPQSELRSLYHAADALALPAEVREGFPLVVQEAAACGLPVVLGNDPGFAPYRDLPGLVLCERTPDAVRTAIRDALAIGVALAEPGRPHPADFFPNLERWVNRMYPPPPARPEVCLARA